MRADFDGDGVPDLAVGAPGESVGSIADAGAVNVLYAGGSGLSGTGSQVFHQDVDGVGSTAESGDGFGRALAVGDFDGDGFDDLAVGAPTEAVGSSPFAGAINVLFGSAAGLTGAGSQLFTHESLGSGATSGPGEEFGRALAAGDFDGDGIDDLAIGIPYGNIDTGVVAIAFGSPTGLDQGRPDQPIHQDTTGLPDTAEDFDEFGATLAAGDLDSDGTDDLVIGVPGESFGSGTTAAFVAGAAHVLFGTSSGVTGAGSLFFTQSTAGVPSDVETGDRFGTSFAIGDFDIDGRGDLAIGAPGESVGTVIDAGAVFVLYGSGTPSRPTGTGSQVFHQDVAGIGSTAEELDEFGAALAVGDFNDSWPGRDDLVVGVPGESVGDVPGAGVVNVLFGSPAGLTGTGSRLITQNDAGVESTAEAGDGFGQALAVADFAGDLLDIDDLVVGAPFEAAGPVDSAGALNVFEGLGGGRIITQGSAGIAGDPEPFDHFGLALATIG